MYIIYVHVNNDYLFAKCTCMVIRLFLTSEHIEERIKLNVPVYVFITAYLRETQ